MLRTIQIKRTASVALALLAVVGVVPLVAHGATDPVEAVFEAEKGPVEVGDMVKVTLSINADVAINAIDLVLAYSPKQLELEQIRDGGSIIDIWGRRDITKEGIVYLKGGAMAPFQGDGGRIVQIVFTAKQVGVGQVSLREGLVFRADGLGSEVALSPKVISFDITEQVGVKAPDQTIQDGTAPTLYSELTRDPYSDILLLVADAKDSESGIQETQIRTKSLLFWGDWHNYQNPQYIPESAWAIELRTINNDGFVVKNTHYRWETLLRPMLIMVVIVLALCAVGGVYIRKRRRA